MLVMPHNVFIHFLPGQRKYSILHACDASQWIIYTFLEGQGEYSIIVMLAGKGQGRLQYNRYIKQATFLLCLNMING